MSDELDLTQFGGTRVVMGDGSDRWQFGWFDLPGSREDVRSRLVVGGQPISFRDAAPNLRGYGAGRSVNLFSIFKSAFGYELPSQYQNRGTCVSRGMKRAQELLLGLMRHTGWPIVLERDNLVSHAFIYGSSRKHGGMLGNQDGSVGAWAAWTVANEGTLLNSDCNDNDNDDALAVHWGYSGPPSEMVAKAKFHLVKRVVQIGSVEEARDFLCSGLGAITVASNVGFRTTRDSRGICRRSGSWAHQMMYAGWDDAAGAFAQAQSWGDNQPGGPRFICAGEECPSYAFGTLAEDAQVQIGAGDTWGVSWMIAWDGPALSWRP